MSWRWVWHGWPLRTADDLAPLARIVPELATGPLWRAAATGPLGALQLEAPLATELAVPDLTAWVTAWERACLGASPFPSGDLVATPRIELALPRLPQAAALVLADLVWTWRVRRNQWLTEHSEHALAAGLDPVRLAELDELWETEYHYRRASIERGAPEALYLALPLLPGRQLDTTQTGG